jgi:coenzyme F420-dependent glucose-6-phosphate dehydrogenase
MVRIGWKAGPEQYNPTELLAYAVSADKAGFDVLDVSDHFHPWSEDGHAPFSWTWLVSPIHCCSGGSNSLSLCPRRTYLGLGTGEALNDYAATGEWPEYESRQERLGEAITLIQSLWKGEEVSFDGKYYQTKKARPLHLQPLRSPSISQPSSPIAPLLLGPMETDCLR